MLCGSRAGLSSGELPLRSSLENLECIGDARKVEIYEQIHYLQLKLANAS